MKNLINKKYSEKEYLTFLKKHRDAIERDVIIAITKTTPIKRKKYLADLIHQAITFLVLNKSESKFYSEYLPQYMIDQNVTPERISAVVSGIEDIVTSYLQREFADRYIAFFQYKKMMSSFSSKIFMNVLEGYYSLSTKELEKEKNTLSSIINNVPVAIFVKDAKKLGFIEWNKASEKVFSLKKSKMIGKTDYDLFPKKEAKYFVSKDKEVLKNHKVKDILRETITTPKGIRVLHTTKAPVYSKSKEPLFLVGISEDITEKEKLQQTLKENEEKFRAIAETAKDAIILSDADDKVVYMNKSAMKMLKLKGYPKRKLHTFMVPNLPKEKYKKDFSVFKKKGKTWVTGHTFELEAKRSNGEIFPIELSVASVKIKNKHHALGIMRDITERKRDEMIIEKNKEFRALLLDNIPSPIFYKKSNGIYYGVNNAYAELVQKPKDKIIGHKAKDIYPPKLTTFKTKTDKEVLKKKGIHTYEVTVPQKKGKDRIILFKKASLIHPYTKEKYISGLGMDITEQRETQEAIAKSKIGLDTIFKASSDLFFVVGKTGSLLRYCGGAKENKKLKHIIGKSILKMVPKQLSKKMQNSFKECKGKEKICKFQYKLKYKNKLRTYEVRLIPYADSFIGIIKNLTDTSGVPCPCLGEFTK